MKLQGDKILGAGPNQHLPCGATLDKSLSIEVSLDAQWGPAQTSER